MFDHGLSPKSSTRYNFTTGLRIPSPEFVDPLRECHVGRMVGVRVGGSTELGATVKDLSSGARGSDDLQRWDRLYCAPLAPKIGKTLYCRERPKLRERNELFLLNPCPVSIPEILTVKSSNL